VVQRTNSAGEADCGGIVRGVWRFFCGAGVGAAGVVVCVGDFGTGGDIDLVCGASGEDGVYRRAGSQRHREELNADGTDAADFADPFIFLRSFSRTSSWVWLKVFCR